MSKELKRQAIDAITKLIGNQLSDYFSAVWLHGYEAGRKAQCPWVIRSFTKTREIVWEVGYYNGGRWYKHKSYRDVRSAEYDCGRLNGVKP